MRYLITGTMESASVMSRALNSSARSRMNCFDRTSSAFSCTRCRMSCASSPITSSQMAMVERRARDGCATIASSASAQASRGGSSPGPRASSSSGSIGSSTAAMALGVLRRIWRACGESESAISLTFMLTVTAFISSEPRYSTLRWTGTGWIMSKCSFFTEVVRSVV